MTPREARLAVVVAAVTLAAYACALAADPYWLDSSELAASAFVLGVAHPPGHPLAMLVGKLVCLLPFGSVALRVGWASALCGALAAGGVALLAARISTRVRGALSTPSPSPSEVAPVDALLGATAGWLYAGSHGLLFSSIRPEVYALSALIVVAIAVELERFDGDRDARRLGRAALLFGLGLGNHHLLVLTMAPAIAVVLFPALRVRRLLMIIGAVALGLCAYVYLPLRASRHPLVDWGVPSTWSRFFWTVSARAFQKSVDRGGGGDVSDVLLALGVELRLVGALLAVAGIYLLVRVKSLRTMGAFLALAALCDALAPALVGFDSANPDAFGYLAPAVGYGAILAIVPLSAVVAAWPGVRVVWLLPLAALAVGAVQLRRDSLASPARGSEARQTFTQFLDGASPRALMITSYFQSIFGLYYLRGVEGARPDVTLLHRHFLTYPGYADEVVWRAPELAPLLSTRDIVPNALDRFAPTVIEYDLDLDARLVAGSRVIDPAGEISERPCKRRFFAWQRYLECVRVCAMGDRAGFAAALQNARRLVGSSDVLDALEARCRS